MWRLVLSALLLISLVTLQGKTTAEFKPVKKTYRAVLDPRYQTKLYPEVLVPVVKITKKLGDTFEKGELLIQLQDEVYYRNYLKSIAKVAQAESKLQAIKQLYEDGISSDYELKTADAELAESKADYAVAAKKFHDTAIRAPFSGKVESLNIKEFELPNVDKELIEIVDDKVLIAKLLVSSDLLPLLNVGQPITVTVAETGDVIRTKLSRVGAMIDPSSSTIKIEAEIDNSAGKWKGGMIGYVSFDEES